jgi:Family of unknown function (DUF6252)
MSRIAFTFLSSVSLCFLLAACSQKAYQADSGSNANNAYNPNNPPSFKWSGTKPLSASINGASFVADTGKTSFFHDTVYKTMYISAFKGSDSGQGFSLVLADWMSAGNSYDISNYNGNHIVWIDSFSDPASNQYYSSYGNSGRVNITENDSAIIAGQFYFAGVSYNRGIDNITNGYFYIKKH